MVLARLPLSRSLLLSALFHGVLFVVFGASLQSQWQEIKVLTPKGIMLEMGSFQATGTMAKTVPAKAPAKMVAKPVLNSPYYHTKNQPHPEVKEGETQGNKLNQLGNATTSSAGSGPLGDPNGVAVQATERYLYELKLLIEQRKIYPAQARMMGQTGKVVVRFVVHQDGTIDQAEIIEASPFTKLNEAALKLIQNVKQFKAIPAEIGKDQWILNVPIHYTLN
jgi:protein TonB